MKKHFILCLLITFNSILQAETTTPTKVVTKKSSIIINLDKLLIHTSGKIRSHAAMFTNEPIYIGDNDEVSFKGEVLEQYAPITVTIGNKKERLLKDKSLHINTKTLKDGDLIRMRDKSGHLFVEMRVFK